MNRREFSAGAACLVGAAALGWPGFALAQRKPEEGKEFRTLDKRVPVDAPAGKIEVIEFFWYSCPHCNAFEPKLVSWIKSAPADIVVRRVPVAFRDDFVPQQRLFYTLEAMGKLDDLHHKVFASIHGSTKEALNREELIVAWAEKNGLDKAKFAETYNSFSVQTKARRATQLQDAYKVEGVPAMGVAGRYYTDGTMAGTIEKALQVTDYLIGEARKAK
ncbi:thiol:disulfide interchange protein DsbA/DsbL [Caenimonas sedimenti]|uniref:Thiol:disulfide interchange protein n=1 Tax=Caenimonas sedimenti TaxID=2596921 RepID=A0A562ZIR7_9BURK|nr:thiol:disulfide interchange protein DsbA/DsbL [Caenimonas sedimenti]TWO68277.1 thiol:disulfide interchange protein DsbA/DsbL [Caenimonas sedimenti]